MRGHCSICDDSFSDAMNDISAIVCGHTFHHHCLTTWTKKSKTCPQCRRAMEAEDEIIKLFFSASPDAEESTQVLRAKIEQLEASLVQQKAMIIQAQQTVEMQAGTIVAMQRQIVLSDGELVYKAALLDYLRIQLEQISEEERKTVNQLTLQYTTSRRAFENVEKQYKITQDELKNQLMALQQAFGDAEKQHKSTQDDLQDQLKSSQRALHDVKEQHKSAQNDFQDQLNASQRAFEDAEKRHDHMQEDILAQLGRMRGDAAEIEKEKEEKKLLGELADTKQVVLTQAEMIESLRKCICGEGPRNVPAQLETKGDFTARIKQLEYANRTLASQLHKYTTNEAKLNTSGTEANASPKLHGRNQSADEQLINCCKVLKSKFVKTKELLQNEHDRNSNILEALNDIDCNMDKTLQSAASGEISTMETTSSWPISKKARTSRGRGRPPGPSRGKYFRH